MLENALATGYMSFLRHVPSQQSIVALKDSDLQNLYRRYPKSERLGRMVAEYLYYVLATRSGALMIETPEQRYRDLVATPPKVMQRIPLYRVASYLGVIPEALSRMRKRIVDKTQIHFLM